MFFWAWGSMRSSIPISFVERPLRALKILVRSNIWIALGAPSLIGVSCLEWERAFPLPFATAAFCFVLLSYNLQRYVRSLKPRSRSQIEAGTGFSTRAYSLLVLGSGIAAFSSLFLLELRVLIALIPVALLSVFYALPVFGSGKGLRDLPYLKVFLIALSWAYLTVLVLGVKFGRSLGPMDGVLFLERAFFVFAITVPFDIRDLPYDDPEARTFPQVLGVKGAKGLALSALSLFLILALVRLQSVSPDPALMVGYTVTAGVTGALIAKADPRKPSLYYEGGLDGTMPLMAGLLLLCRTLL